MKNLVNVIAFLLLILPQVSAQYCGMQDAPPIDDVLLGPCSTNSIWNNNATYIPVEQDVTALSIKINFIFWQREDGVIGNFQENNPNHNYFIEEVINEMNRRISNLVDPLNDDCYNGNPDYLKDARIRYDVKSYYISDGYLWDIENATPNSSSDWYCPMDWSQTYTDLAYQRLEEHNVRHGLNVFFGNEGSSFQTLVIDHLTDDYNSVAGLTDCSEWPGGQNDLSKRLRVAMTNEFLKYEFRGNITQDPVWQMDFDGLKYSMAKVVLHELGHSFSLSHHGCSNDIMRGGSNWTGNYLESNQMGQMLKSLHLSSVRQYVTCEVGGNKPRILSGYHKWGFDTKVYTDIILEAGAELEICGNVYMPKGGRIHVKRGAKLFVNGGKISLNREEYTDCPDEFWGGIVVWGNKDKAHSDVDVNNLLPDDPGVVILNNAIIEYAALGIDAFRFEVDGSDNSYAEYSGGIIQADESSFKDCGSISYFTPYPFENDSYFKGCSFVFEGQASIFGGGIRAIGVHHLDFDNCTFKNLGNYGISLLNSGANIHNGCSFSEMTHGIYATAWNVQSPPILIGSYNDTESRNEFTQNTCGIYAFGVSNLRVINNDFTANNFGLAIKGETGSLSYKNDFDDHIIGERFEQSGGLSKTSSCNVFTNTARGLYAVGSNPGVTFKNDDFSNTNSSLENIDVMLQSKETPSSTTLGSIYNFQGVPWSPVFNLFSDNVSATRILATIGDTEIFNYYTDLNTAEPRYIPDCSLNFPNGCTEVFNFWLWEGIGDPDPCLGEEEIICDTKDCLDEEYAAIILLQQQIDGGDKDGLLQRLTNAPTSSITKQALLESSPYLSDEVLKAILMSSMSPFSRAEILLLNAALSVDIMTEANGKIPATDLSNLEIIRNNNPVSAKDELNHRLTLAKQKKNEVLYANIKRLEQEGDYVSIETFLLNDNTTLAMRTLIGFKAKWGEITAAQVLWQSLPITTIEEVEAKAILAINIQRYEEGGNFELDATQVSNLYTIAEGQSPQSAYAMGLLALLKDEVFIPELPKEEVKALTQSGNENEIIQPKTEKAKTDIRLFPNPTKNKVQLEIPTHLEEWLSITVHNMYGQEVKLIRFNNTGNLTIDVGNLSAGVYIISIRKANALLSTQKIIRN